MDFEDLKGLFPLLIFILTIVIDKSSRRKRKKERGHFPPLPDIEQPESDAQQQQTTGGGQGQQVRLGQEAAEQGAEGGQRPLHHQHRQGGGHHADPQRGREGQRGETVQDRLQDELVGTLAQTVGQRTQNGQRADDEQQGGGDVALDETFPRAQVGLSRRYGVLEKTRTPIHNSHPCPQPCSPYSIYLSFPTAHLPRSPESTSVVLRSARFSCGLSNEPPAKNAQLSSYEQPRRRPRQDERKSRLLLVLSLRENLYFLTQTSNANSCCSIFDFDECDFIFKL